LIKSQMYNFAVNILKLVSLQGFEP